MACKELTAIEITSCRKPAFVFSNLASVYLLVAVVVFLCTNPMQSRYNQAQLLLSNTGPPNSASCVWSHFRTIPLAAATTTLLETALPPSVAGGGGGGGGGGFGQGGQCPHLAWHIFLVLLYLW